MNVAPLPHIPRVASTLRRDLAHFKPLPLINHEESEEDTDEKQPLTIPVPPAIHTIRRKPVPVSTPRNDNISSSVISNTQLTLAALPAEGGRADFETSKDNVNTACQDEVATVETTNESDDPQFRLPALDLSLSPCVSLSDFPAPPTLAKIEVSRSHTHRLPVC